MIPCDFCPTPATRLSTKVGREDRRFACEEMEHRRAAGLGDEPLPGRSRFVWLEADELRALWREVNKGAAPDG